MPGVAGGGDGHPAYGIDLQSLRELMDHKGPEAIERIRAQYGNVFGLCELLQTSTNQGKQLLFGHVYHFPSICLSCLSSFFPSHSFSHIL